MGILLSQVIVGAIGFLIGIGILFFVFRNIEPEFTFLQGNMKNKMNKSLRKSLKAKRENNLLYGTQKYLDINVYNMTRHVVLGFFVLLTIMQQSFGYVLFGLIIYLLSYPKEYTEKNRKLPFHYFVQNIRNAEIKKKDHELMETLSVLKNLMVQQKDNPLGADYIVDYLSQSTKLTKPAYLIFLSKMRLGQTEEAIRLFTEEINTDLGKDMAYLLSQLDKLNPVELEEAVITRQRHVREMKTTEQKNQDQLKSDLIYIPVVMTVLAIFMNFIVIVFWVEQKTSLTQILRF